MNQIQKRVVGRLGNLIPEGRLIWLEGILDFMEYTGCSEEQYFVLELHNFLMEEGVSNEKIKEFCKLQEKEHPPAPEEWISVKDRLPEKAGGYLVRYVSRRDSGSVAVEGVTEMTYTGETVRGEKLWRWKWHGRLSLWEITHWRPLPAPPKTAVTTVCYGKTETWDSREDAIKFFLEGMNSCEGSERDRYTNIYLKLIAGDAVCSDK